MDKPRGARPDHERIHPREHGGGRPVYRSDLQAGQGAPTLHRRRGDTRSTCPARGASGVRKDRGQLTPEELVPFNRAYVTGAELPYIRDAIEHTRLSGNGPYASRCEQWLEQRTGARRVLLTPSATAALEMAGLLLGIEPGDEVIMPSFAFPSSANAVVLRGGVPVFVDIRKDTLNLDEGLVAAAITGRTKALLPVHYAGVGAEMDGLAAIAHEHRLSIVEDAAQGILSS